MARFRVRTPVARQRRHLARASRRARAPARCRSPISVAFHLRVTRRCTMLRMCAPSAAPHPAHRRSHRSRHSCRRSCGARLHFVRHCLAQCAPQRRPLNRRGGSPPPGSPASISRPPVQRESGIDPPGRALGLTPHAAGCERAHARVLRALAGPCGAVRRHSSTACCWSERVSRATRRPSPSCRRVAAPVGHRSAHRPLPGRGVFHACYAGPVRLASPVIDRSAREFRAGPRIGSGAGGRGPG